MALPHILSHGLPEPSVQLQALSLKSWVAVTEHIRGWLLWAGSYWSLSGLCSPKGVP